MRRLLSLFTFIRILYSCDDGDSSNVPPPVVDPNVYDWTFQGSTSLINYTDVYFADEQFGWVVGDNNTILSTSSGGASWPQAPVNSFDGNFRSVHLIDAEKGWIAGDLNGSRPDGSVYVSLIGGAYPTAQTTADLPMNTVFMLDEEYGWSGGANGQILYTQDGSEWFESQADLPIDIYDIHFTDQQNGWLTGTNGYIYRSKDGGISWEEEYRIPGIDLFALQMIDTVQGWACGLANTLMLRTIDNGNVTWTVTPVDSEFGGLDWYDLHFVSKEKGWIVGQDGAIHRTENGGINWIKETTSAQGDLNAVYMVNENKGWIAGDLGIILTYTPQ